MIFTATGIEGAFVIDVERKEDERGFFARTWDGDELRAYGLEANIVQSSISYNARRATLRGMHFQRSPHEETKLVRCTAGAIHDVLVDLRPASPTHRKWIALELSADNRRTLYVPRGVAHGFLTLTDASEVLYLIGTAYVAEASAGVRWDDPAFAIEWPFAPEVISERDRTWPPHR